MLGAQSWFLALGIPTLTVGGFIASRKRLAYQWREELMDMESGPYGKVSDGQMEMFRRVAPAASPPADSATGEVSSGVELDSSENIGLSVQTSILSQEAAVAILDEIKAWSQRIGNPMDSRKVATFARRLAQESQLPDAPSALKTLSSAFYARVRLISDHPEDIQLMRAPWGCGDRIRHEDMPAALRFLVKQTQNAWEDIGRLRHVYIEYSPSGEFFREPKAPKHYDGHDYVVIPLRRDRKPTVVTISPNLRSRVSYLKEVVQNSWTNRDVDALVPFGEMLRVYGTARYDWGWGIRPGKTWFGSSANTIDRLRVYRDANGDAKLMLTAPPPSRRSPAAWLSTWSRRGAPTECDNSYVGDDAALVVLHFEGPRSKGKQRSLLFQPERWIFGVPPSVESYETWVEDRPTAEAVRQEGVLRFLIRNYYTMLTVS